MNELVIMHNKQAVTTSLRVAEVFGKDHKNVMQAIKAKIQSAENSADYQKMFAEGTYKDGILAAEKLAAKRGHQIDDTQKQRITTIQ